MNSPIGRTEDADAEKAIVADGDDIEASKTEAEAEAADLEDSLKADIADTNEMEASEIDWMSLEERCTNETTIYLDGVERSVRLGWLDILRGVR